MIRLYFIFLLSAFSVVTSAQVSIGDSLKVLPVQSGGRVQPFDSFASQSLHFIYGKTHFNKRGAVDILMSWMLLPEYWDKINFIQVNSFVLRKALKLKQDQILLSPADLLKNKIFIQEVAQLRVKKQNKESLNNYFKSLQKLENRWLLYQYFKKGIVPGWVPSLKNKNWLPLSQLKKKSMEQKLFQQIITAYIATVFTQQNQNQLTNKNQNQSTKQNTNQNQLTQQNQNQPTKQNSNQLTNKSQNQNLNQNQLTQQNTNSNQLTNKNQNQLTNKNQNQLTNKNQNLKQSQQNLKTSITNFKNKISVKYPIYKNYLSKVTTELHYNKLNPFHLAWIFYLLGLIILFLHSVLCSKKYFFYIALSVLSAAFLIQGYGIALRSFIMERPPVTNMYETVLWVPWVAVIFGTLLWIREKAFSVFVCSCVVALFCLLLADSAPTLLGGNLEPLEAVLRSNFWLSTHVLIIVMSYSAFFLAFVIGDVLLFLLLNEKKHQNQIRLYTKCIDRSIQIGVILLAIGTFLGGVWADYSWGRFWGWDPKETWALISLLGYLALLHGRLMSWIKKWGLAIGAIVMFFLIIMTWYGVNYGLSQGLHSYGFGYGGIEYVASFALLHIIYILVIRTIHNKKIS